MFSRFVTVVIIIPIAIVLIALAVANRAPVTVTIDPFNPGNPVLSTTLPLFVLMFGAAAVGLILGSLATWWKQGRYRKLARQKAAEAARTPAPAKAPAAAPPERPMLTGPAI